MNNLKTYTIDGQKPLMLEMNKNQVLLFYGISPLEKQKRKAKL